MLVFKFLACKELKQKIDVRLEYLTGFFQIKNGFDLKF